MSFANQPYSIKQVETEMEFEAYFDLRWRLLRKPWQQVKGSEQDEIEQQCYHLIAVDNKNNVIAVARLQSNNASEAQVRYMAVDTQHQNRGIGRALMKQLESHAISLGHKTIALDAREIATGFYRKLGYIVESESYLLFDEIQHFKMTKQLKTEQA